MTVTEPILVIDFGTTTSSAMLVAPDGSQLVREPGSDREWWPSAVCVDGAQVLVGSPAEQLRRSDPLAYRGEFKRDLGEDAPIPLGDRSFLPQELVTKVVAAIADEARRITGGPLTRAVLTVPASYSPADPRWDLMIEAGESVGFTEVELLAEPVAAAFAPVRGVAPETDATVLVYDFGGGTFDAALIRMEKSGRPVVLGCAAEATCGGRDIDAVMYRRLVEHGGDQLATKLADDPRRAPFIRAELSEMVRRIKHYLSDALVAPDFLHATDQRVTMERSELEELCRPVVEQSVRCCQSLIADSDATPTVALLVGGTCRMPLIADMVATELGCPVRFAKDVSTAVVRGAAAWARQAGDRGGPPSPYDPDERPLRWDLPTGSGTLVRWLVEPGAAFAAQAPLASVRLADGTLYGLTAGNRSGTLRRVLVERGKVVTGDDWLVTVTGPGAGSRLESEPVAAPVSSRPFLELPGANTVSFLNRGEMIAVSGVGGVAVWDVRSRELVAEFDSPAERCHVATTPNGRRFAAMGQRALTLWELPKTRIRRHDRSEAGGRVALDRTGDVMAIGVHGGQAEVFRAGTGMELPTHVVVEHKWQHRGRGPVDVALSPDGRTLATAYCGVVHVWNTVDGSCLRTLRLSSDGFSRVAFTSDGRLLAAAGPFGATVWEAGTGAVQTEIPGEPFYDITFVDRDKGVVTVDRNRVQFWDVETGAETRRFESMGGQSVALSTDCQWMAVAAPTGNRVILRSL